MVYKSNTERIQNNMRLRFRIFYQLLQVCCIVSVLITIVETRGHAEFLGLLLQR